MLDWFDRTRESVGASLDSANEQLLESMGLEFAAAAHPQKGTETAQEKGDLAAFESERVREQARRQWRNLTKARLERFLIVHPEVHVLLCEVEVERRSCIF